MMNKISTAFAIILITVFATFVGIMSWIWCNYDNLEVYKASMNLPPKERCVKEGAEISSMPLPPNGAKRMSCCEGLVVIPIDAGVVDAGYCTKCGDGLCKKPENEGNCPADCSGDKVGNDRDEHGCIGSAGYSWCEEKQKCLRSWEESCSKEIWKSEAQGDLISDQRDPKDVCQNLQKRENLANCQLLISKTSNDPVECAGGSSVAGCFACKFLCQ
jgi:hypothetical protein